MALKLTTKYLDQLGLRRRCYYRRRLYPNLNLHLTLRPPPHPPPPRYRRCCRRPYRN